ncbi:MAG: M90 family metallopeptidase [bacterium]
MAQAILLLGIVTLIGGPAFYFLVLRPKWRESRRRRLVSMPFPSEWESVLQNDVPLYNRLPEPLKIQLRGLIRVFLDEKNFEGCGGLEINDRIRVCVAAQACVLLLNRKTDYYRKLGSILVYPHTYVAETSVSVDMQTIQEEVFRCGESWSFGTVVLAWDHVSHGARDIHDGHNVVLHEFAHQLDQEDGVADGTPLLGQRSNYVTWARILGAEYAELQRKVGLHRRDVLDEYGATNPAEFFAVATEAFFENPKQLKKKHPDLYDELMNFYKLDPSQWL